MLGAFASKALVSLVVLGVAFDLISAFMGGYNALCNAMAC
jgi:hypothetical protein